MGNLRNSEPWLVELLFLLKDELEYKTFVDVGANIGQTLLKVRAMSDDLPYIGFEPNPHCVSYLHELCKVNRFNNVEIIPVGIASDTKIMPLKLFGNSMIGSAASIIENYRPENRVVQTVKVPVLARHAIEELLTSETGIIKIDVEGAELEVIESLKHIIDRDRSILIVEILPVYEKSNSIRLKRQNEIEKILQTMDYVIFRILRNIDDHFLKIEELDGFGIHGNLDLSDYLFLPKEKVEQLKLLLFNQ